MTMLTSPLPVQNVGSILPINRLNDILGLELAAHACYAMTADRWQASDRAMWVGLLRQLAEEHELAAQSIREQISELGNEPADESGSLGLWAPVARAMRADRSTLVVEACRAEQQMLAHYEGAVSALDSGSAQLLRNLLIPAQRRHVQLLTELTSG